MMSYRLLYSETTLIPDTKSGLEWDPTPDKCGVISRYLTQLLDRTPHDERVSTS